MPEARWPLPVAPATLRSVDLPETLTLWLGRQEITGPSLSPTVIADDAVTAGQALGTVDDAPIAPSPVAGTVTAVRQAPDVRGGKPGLAVILAPAPSADGDSPPAVPFAPLDPAGAPPEALRARLAEAGVAAPALAETAVVLAAPTEPWLSAPLARLLDDPAAAARAARLAARVAGASRAVLAVLEASASTVRPAAEAAGVELLTLPAEYPATLPDVVARRVAPRGPRPAVVALAPALAALAAVERGEVPAATVVTVLGPGGPVGDFRAPLGLRLADLLAAAGLTPAPGDAIVTGGPFRGLAQYSLDAAVTLDVDAVTLVKAGTIPSWSDEPCINCGACIDVCPEALQAHHLARYSEFHLFDRCPEHRLDDCIECGLCATVCPARRPLLQLIRLAKRELRRQAALEAAATPAPAPEPAEVPAGTTQD